MCESARERVYTEALLDAITVEMQGQTGAREKCSAYQALRIRSERSVTASGLASQDFLRLACTIQSRYDTALSDLM